MARTRSLKPGFFKNEDLAALGPFAMLLYAGLWTIADREGRLEYRPKRIKAEIFPYSRVSVESLLEELAREKFIVLYDVGNERFISIPTWRKHQTPHVKEGASTIPAPDKHRTSTGQAPDKTESKTPLTLNPEPLTLNPEPVPRAPVPALTFPPDLSGYAKRIHDRHPKGHKGSLQATERAFAALVGSAVAPEREAAAVDANHEAWCRSDRWKSGYVLALDRFLTPDRAYAEPPDPVKDPMDAAFEAAFAKLKVKEMPNGPRRDKTPVDTPAWMAEDSARDGE